MIELDVPIRVPCNYPPCICDAPEEAGFCSVFCSGEFALGKGVSYECSCGHENCERPQNDQDENETA